MLKRGVKWDKCRIIPYNWTASVFNKCRPTFRQWLGGELILAPVLFKWQVALCTFSKPESYSCSRVGQERIPEWEVEPKLHEFVTSEIDGSKWSVSRFSCFNPGRKSPDNHRMCAGIGLALGHTQIHLHRVLTRPLQPNRDKTNRTLSSTLNCRSYWARLFTLRLSVFLNAVYKSSGNFSFNDACYLYSSYCLPRCS